jgi:hypothetical protein
LDDFRNESVSSEQSIFSYFGELLKRVHLEESQTRMKWFLIAVRKNSLN